MCWCRSVRMVSSIVQIIAFTWEQAKTLRIHLLSMIYYVAARWECETFNKYIYLAFSPYLFFSLSVYLLLALVPDHTKYIFAWRPKKSGIFMIIWLVWRNWHFCFLQFLSFLFVCFFSFTISFDPFVSLKFHQLLHALNIFELA